ncbi:TPR repeat-containing protein YrrB [Candidatus Brocadiaceae bacterium B188]|nr:TPR repeat-containing protein YrrB [Candidatus Brocadiaceae bacterium B188]
MRIKSVVAAFISFLTKIYDFLFARYFYKSAILYCKSEVFWPRFACTMRKLMVLCVVCAIFSFQCFFMGTRYSLFILFADDSVPGPAWLIDTQPASLARTALEIAQESYPEIDIEMYLRKLAEIVENVTISLRDETEPEQIIKTINLVLFNELQFTYVQTGDLDSLSLNKILDSKTGNCVGLSILYLCIAEGLHIPLCGVSVPEHIFVRYDDGDFRRNIETGYEGMFTPDSYYINMPGKRISPGSIRNGYYLKNLSRNEVVADIYLNRSIIQKENGNIKASLQDVNRAIEFHCNDAVAFCNRGVLYEKMHDPDRALDDYNKAVALNPDYAPVYYNRGSVYASKEMFDKAIMDYSKAIALYPNSILSYYNRGMVFKMIGRGDLSIGDLTSAISLDPKFAPAYAQRGLVYAESGEPEKALADFNRGLELDPTNTEIYMKRSILYADAQRFDEAIADITAFIQYAKDNAFAYYIRAKAYRGKGDIEKSLEDYNKMIELSPRLAGVYYERGQIKNLLKMPDEALEDFTHSIELFPYNSLAYLHRGNTFQKLGKNEKARKDYEVYLKLNPDASDSEEVKNTIEHLKDNPNH